MSSLKHYALHSLEQNIYPDVDKEQWLAYLTLKLKYKHITCQSSNGYWCEGIADYERGIIWQYDRIIDLASKDVLLVTEPFHTLNTPNIVNTWMRVCGETTKTKHSWVSNLRGMIGNISL